MRAMSWRRSRAETGFPAGAPVLLEFLFCEIASGAIRRRRLVSPATRSTKGPSRGTEMTDSDTRRDFFAWTRNSLAAAGIAGAVPTAAEAAAPAGEDYYDKLGVIKIINAAGTYTALTASIMPPQVQ